MSWLFGYKQPANLDIPQIPDDKLPPPPPSPVGNDKKNIEKAIGAFKFDSAALERAAQAARELEKSKYATEALELSKNQEKTLQLQHQAQMKQYEATIEQLKIDQIRVAADERRKNFEDEAKLQKSRAEYQDHLARKRAEDDASRQKRLQDELLYKQEQSIEKQEALKRKTIEYESQLRHENEMKQIKAKIQGEAQVERENREIRFERSRMEQVEFRQTVLDSINSVGSLLGKGINFFLEDKQKVTTAVVSLSALAGGVYLAKYSIRTTAKIVENRIGKPSLVRETSRINFVDAFKSPVKTIRRTMGNEKDALEGIILKPDLEAHLRRIAIATRYTKANGGFYRNVLMAGPPGTGKTMFAKSLANNSGLDYAILTGGDIAPLGSEGVTAVHKIFDWAKTSRKGLLIFVDEADAFLRKRDKEHISEGMRATLNAFLYRTGEQSKNCMLVLASNQPEQFDWAINDRMDEIVYFDLPGLEERERIVRHYFDMFLLQPSLDKNQRIRLSEDIPYSEKCREIAEKTANLSGRELSKVAIAWQAAAFSSADGILTSQMMDTVVESAIAANKKKWSWRQHGTLDNVSA